MPILKTIEFLGHVLFGTSSKTIYHEDTSCRKFPNQLNNKTSPEFSWQAQPVISANISGLFSDDSYLLDLARKRKNPFVFGTLQKAAFEKLKNIMSEGPLLHIYKYGRKNRTTR
ncbi:hypothetical protein TNIN_457371 [Trichonephila inaurata madagascariensis]|uniref:Uncharacterized protein n=1 Tax=Trichonephila inaurata madagascariensis TaxID=2747483 RepID=A0A8X6X353_9ARAC|nr:hypothetical protein TNIN_457371 [Trichonephila inaurata madagascariensis]